MALLTARLDLLQLRREAGDEELEPAGQIHALLAHALQRGVERLRSRS